VAENDPTIDLTTLQEVQRLLASTDFATADDLVGRGGAISPVERRPAAAGLPLSAPPAGEALSPLPRRR
jgi:hypothetical protein